MKAEKSITVTGILEAKVWMKLASCLAQFASRVQRCLDLHPGILDAERFASSQSSAGQISITELKT
ncbi:MULTISPECIES: hypothetical protein [Bradyrhizobium]|uniref:hypothetical protein n=1 Tax=Bradyrhizobium TaxID=374 RepID=UPI001AECCBE1|nr:MULTISPECIES: hypothetical protein [Bradyrhizobium]